MEKTTIEIYPDGAHHKATKVGGWGVVTVRKGERIVCDAISGFLFETSSQRMEQVAMVNAFYFASIWESRGWNVEVYSDSGYVTGCFIENWYIRWMMNNWNNYTVVNIDLWDILLKQWRMLRDTRIFKIKGHSGIEWNEAADQLAKEALEKGKMEYGKYSDL